MLRSLRWRILLVNALAGACVIGAASCAGNAQRPGDDTRSTSAEAQMKAPFANRTFGNAPPRGGADSAARQVATHAGESDRPAPPTGAAWTIFCEKVDGPD